MGTSPPPDQARRHVVAVINTNDDLVAFYKKSFPEKLQALRNLPGDTLASTMDLFGNFTWPRARYIAFANNHSMHHRGQLAAYLRAMGSRVPNIYGPSADDKEG